MKLRWSSLVDGARVCLLACLFALSSQIAQAQVQVFRRAAPQGGAVIAAAQGAHFEHRLDGPGTGAGRGFVIMLGGPGGAVDIGASLLKASDADQDGVATPEETKIALIAWFQQADGDTNGVLVEAELATAVQQAIPMPPPPAGFSAPPIELALHALLAKKLMTTIDSDADGGLTLKEAVSFVDARYAQWDLDGSGAMDASEFAAAFAQYMPEPPGTFQRRVRALQIEE